MLAVVRRSGIASEKRPISFRLSETTPATRPRASSSGPPPSPGFIAVEKIARSSVYSQLASKPSSDVTPPELARRPASPTLATMKTSSPTASPGSLATATARGESSPADLHERDAGREVLRHDLAGELAPVEERHPHVVPAEHDVVDGDDEAVGVDEARRCRSARCRAPPPTDASRAPSPADAPSPAASAPGGARRRSCVRSGAGGHLRGCGTVSMRRASMHARALSLDLDPWSLFRALASKERPFFIDAGQPWGDEWVSSMGFRPRMQFRVTAATRPDAPLARLDARARRRSRRARVRGAPTAPVPFAGGAGRRRSPTRPSTRSSACRRRTARRADAPRLVARALRCRARPTIIAAAAGRSRAGTSTPPASRSGGRDPRCRRRRRSGVARRRAALAVPSDALDDHDQPRRRDAMPRASRASTTTSPPATSIR